MVTKKSAAGLEGPRGGRGRLGLCLIFGRKWNTPPEKSRADPPSPPGTDRRRGVRHPHLLRVRGDLGRRPRRHVVPRDAAPGWGGKGGEGEASSVPSRPACRGAGGRGGTHQFPLPKFRKPSRNARCSLSVHGIPAAGAGRAPVSSRRAAQPSAPPVHSPPRPVAGRRPRPPPSHAGEVETRRGPREGPRARGGGGSGSGAPLRLVPAPGSAGGSAPGSFGGSLRFLPCARAPARPPPRGFPRAPAPSPPASRPAL